MRLGLGNGAEARSFVIEKRDSLVLAVSVPKQQCYEPLGLERERSLSSATQSPLQRPIQWQNPWPSQPV